MSWKKLGLVFSPDKNFEWMQTHAANTVVLPLEKNLFSVFFSTRDAKNRSSVARTICELNQGKMSVIEIDARPVLSPGQVGLFDDSGVSLSCITTFGQKNYMYYLGWNLGVTVPWRNSIGLAISENQTDFKRRSLAPLMDRHDLDPYSISYPFVFKDTDRFRMWYGSNLSWGKEQNEMAHVIKYAESQDGLNWRRTGQIALNFKDAGEYAISRPFVVKEQGLYKMWYSYRGKSYRIGYAESQNALEWNRLDHKVGIDVSPEGWDSEMIEYPFIFDHQGSRYMTYNGNGYGRTGFGLAVLDNL